MSYRLLPAAEFYDFALKMTAYLDDAPGRGDPLDDRIVIRRADVDTLLAEALALRALLNGVNPQ